MKKIKKIIIIILVIIFIFMLAIIFNNKYNINKLALNQYHINIAGHDVDISKVVGDTPNMPQIGAGMIPIKWNTTTNMWQITNKQDNEWYNYEQGKMATVMLSDGYFVSELRQNMENNKLAEDGAQIQEEQLGTIFVWIPRIVCINDDFEYLQETSILESTNYAMPKCFTYNLQPKNELALTGIWVKQMPDENEISTQEEIEKMQREDNEHGLIRNEIVEKITNDANKAVKTLQNGKNNKQQVVELENTNRTMIRVVKTSEKTPIIGHAEISENKIIYIYVTYTKFGIDKIISLNTGEKLSEAENATMAISSDGVYKFAIIDEKGNIKIVTVEIGAAKPDLTGFRVDKTYVVTYITATDGKVTENSSILIKDVLTENSIVNDNVLIKGGVDEAKVKERLGKNWYNYSEQEWANIVVKNEDVGKTAYFVWVPRYVYQLDSQNEKSNVKFVTIDNIDSEGNEVDLNQWNLPEAFSWIDKNGNTVQLPGFWMSKYGLSD